MNPAPDAKKPPGAGREEWTSAVFASMVLQQTNLALMLLGKVPHPETQERLHEPESARVLIDQLEMIEVKTRGNLAPDEDRLLKQSLMALRMAFVETAGRPPSPTPPGPGAAGSPAPPTAGAAATPAPFAPGAEPPAPASQPPSEPHPPQEPGDSRKKFTKRYE